MLNNLYEHSQHLANIDGIMNSNVKSDLIAILTEDIIVLPSPMTSQKTDPWLGACVLIDGHGLIQRLAACKTFHDHAETFARSIFMYSSTKV